MRRMSRYFSSSERKAIVEVVNAPVIVADNPRELRSAANAARDAHNFPLASLLYGKLLKLQPTDGALWLQHGHMLKELGLFQAAGMSYQRATELMPESPESYVQRAILAKFVGDFDGAIELFAKAETLGYGNPQFLIEELGFLRRTEPRVAVRAFEDDEALPLIKVFLSSTTGAPRGETAAELGGFVGLANYSYSFVVKGYVEAFEHLGIEYEFVSHPEYIPDIRSRSGVATNLHIGFYPPNAPRLLKGAYNVFVTAWEFERLPSAGEVGSYHAFSNPATMLSVGNEVWSISEYGAEALRRADVPHVFSVPTPVLSNIRAQPRTQRPTPKEVHRLSSRLERLSWVPLAIVPQLMSASLDEGDRRTSTLRTLLFDREDAQKPIVFFTMFNVYDYRKQIKPIIEAFIKFARHCPNAFLIIKIAVVNRTTGRLNEHLFAEQIADVGEVSPPYVSDRIWMTCDALSREELVTLYDLASFYVSTSHGEGQNLPLIEAMLRGVVPVAVDNTAMRDYIKEENAVVVPCTLAPFNTRLIDRYKMSGLNTYYVAQRDVHACLQRAVALEPGEYGAKSMNALSTAREAFGIVPFQASMERVIRSATEWSAGAGARP